MSVTYRRVRTDDPAYRPPKLLTDRTCSRCGTRGRVHVVPAERITIKVDGPTCPRCNPRSPKKAAEDGAAQRVVKVWWAAVSGQSPRWRTLRTGLDQAHAVGSDQARVVPTSAPPAGPAAAVNVAWREALAPQVSRGFDEASWVAVRNTWGSHECSATEALADILDDVWKTAVPEAASTRIEIRLVGLMPVVSTVVPDVLERWLTAAPEETVARYGSVLRGLSAVVCGATGQAATCGRIHRTLPALPASPDQDVLVALDAPRVLAALTAHSTLPTLADLLGLGSPEQVPEPVPIVPVEVPDDGLSQVEHRLRVLGEPPTKPAIFGDR